MARRPEEIDPVELRSRDSAGLWLLWPTTSIVLNMLWITIGFVILLAWYTAVALLVGVEWVADQWDKGSR